MSKPLTTRAEQVMAWGPRVLVALALVAGAGWSGGCRDDLDDGVPPPSVGHRQAQQGARAASGDAPPADAAPSRAASGPAASGPAPTGDPELSAPMGDPGPPAPMGARLEREAVIDVDGAAFGVAVDAQGQAVITTRDGREAAYLLPGEAEAGAALASAALPGPALIPRVLAPGRFAVLTREPEGTLSLLAVTDATPPRLVVSGQVTLGGAPVDLTSARGLIWIVDHAAEGGRGLAVLDPSLGEVVARLETGRQQPAELTVVDTPEGARLFLTTRDDAHRHGAVLVYDADALSRPPRYQPIEGLPVRVIDGGPLPVVYALRNAVTALQALDEVDGRVVAVLELGVQPLTALVTADGEALIALGDQGELVRWRLHDQGTRLTREAAALLSPGSHQLALWPDGEELVAIDHRARSLKLIDARTLEVVDALPLDGLPGRLVLDPARERILVTLPQREQVVRVARRPAP